MKRKREESTNQSETSPPSVAKHLVPALLLEERGWECVGCLTENAEEDLKCWICKVGTKGEAGEKGKTCDRQFKASRLGKEMSSPTRKLADPPPDGDSLKGAWKKNNPFGELSDDDEIGEDHDISITTGDDGVLSNNKGTYELRVRQYATGQTRGTLGTQSKQMEGGQWGDVTRSSGMKDQDRGGGKIVGAGKLPDGCYEDEDGNPGTYGPAST